MSAREGQLRFEQIEVRHMGNGGSIQSISYEKRLQQFLNGDWVDIPTVARDRVGEFYECN